MGYRGGPRFVSCCGDAGSRVSLDDPAGCGSGPPHPHRKKGGELKHRRHDHPHPWIRAAPQGGPCNEHAPDSLHRNPAKHSTLPVAPLPSPPPLLPHSGIPNGCRSGREAGAGGARGGRSARTTAPRGRSDRRGREHPPLTVRLGERGRPAVEGPWAGRKRQATIQVAQGLVNPPPLLPRGARPVRQAPAGPRCMRPRRGGRPGPTALWTARAAGAPGRTPPPPPVGRTPPPAGGGLGGPRRAEESFAKPCQRIRTNQICLDASGEATHSHSSTNQISVFSPPFYGVVLAPPLSNPSKPLGLIAH